MVKFRTCPRQSFQIFHKYFLSLQTSEPVLLLPSGGFLSYNSPPGGFLSYNSACSSTCVILSSLSPWRLVLFSPLTDEDTWSSERYKATSPRLNVSKWIEFQACLTLNPNALSTILHCLQKENWQGEVCHLSVPWPQVYVGGPLKLSQVGSTVLRTVRKWVVVSVLNVAEELEMSPPACHWYLSFSWLKGLFPIKTMNWTWDW